MANTPLDCAPEQPDSILAKIYDEETYFVGLVLGRRWLRDEEEATRAFLECLVIITGKVMGGTFNDGLNYTRVRSYFEAVLRNWCTELREKSDRIPRTAPLDADRVPTSLQPPPTKADDNEMRGRFDRIERQDLNGLARFGNWL